MWPEILWLPSVLTGSAALCVVASIQFKPEIGRLARIVRAELGAAIRLRKPMRRYSIEQAVALDVEVDMEWWDEQFAKLQPKPLPSLTRMWGVWHDNQAASFEELEYRTSHVVLSVTDGNLTFSQDYMDEEARQAIFRETKSMISRYEPSIPQWLRESLAARVARAYADPEATQVAMDAVKAALANAKREREQADVEADCEFCEYSEVRTYADRYVKKIKTERCWDCDREQHAEAARSLAMMAASGMISANEAQKHLLDARPDVSAVMQKVFA